MSLVVTIFNLRHGNTMHDWMILISKTMYDFLFKTIYDFLFLMLEWMLAYFSFLCSGWARAKVGGI